MEHFEPLDMKHKADTWEINTSISLVKNYMLEYIRLMEKDDSLCIGCIMEASAQMRRVTQGIGEMETYLLYNKDILLADSGNDMFHLFFDLTMRAGAGSCDIEGIKKNIDAMIEFIAKMKFYDEKLVKYRISEYKNFDGSASDDVAATSLTNGQQAYVEETYEVVDYLEHILNYAGKTES